MLEKIISSIREKMFLFLKSCASFENMQGAEKGKQ
jgi:hypothetical protein